MPSRRSDRGGSLRRQAEAAKAAQPDLEKSIEARRRWEDERDATYRAGWEEWDYLDNDTRQDLVRESVVLGGLAAAGDIATSPRRLGVNKVGKEFLKKLAPDLAKKALAAKPRKAAQDLMNRINQVRQDRLKFENLSRPVQERINTLRTALGKKPYQTQHGQIPRGTEPQVGPPSNINAWGEPIKIAGENALQRLGRNVISRSGREYLPKDIERAMVDRWVANAINASTQYSVNNIRDAYYRSGGDQDWMQNLLASPGARAENELGRQVRARQAAEAEARRTGSGGADWREGRDWTGVSRTGTYYELDGRPTKGAKETGDINLWDIPIDRWNEYFTYDPKRDKKN